MSGCSSRRVDRDLVAVDDVEDAVGQARLLEQLGREDRCRGILLGWLQDEGVAAGDRGSPHPHRDHRGEVERRDARDDADRLTDRVDVDAGRGLLRELPLQQGRYPAGELDHLEAARHLAHRVGEDLAVLGDEQLREVLLVGVDELADVEHQLGALGERDAAPRGERLPCDRYRGADFVDGCQVDGTGLPAGRRVEDRARPARGPLDGAAADPVVEGSDSGIGGSWGALTRLGCEFGHVCLLKMCREGISSARVSRSQPYDPFERQDPLVARAQRRDRDPALLGGANDPLVGGVARCLTAREEEKVDPRLGGEARDGGDRSTPGRSGTLEGIGDRDALEPELAPQQTPGSSATTARASRRAPGRSHSRSSRSELQPRSPCGTGAGRCGRARHARRGWRQRHDRCCVSPCRSRESASRLLPPGRQRGPGRTRSRQLRRRPRSPRTFVARAP